MARKRIIQAVALSMLVLVTVAFFMQLHFIDDATGGVLLWNSEEAYFFAGLSRDGYHLNAIQYLITFIPAYFGVPRTRDDTRPFTIVFRITPTGVEKYVMPDIGFRAYIPVGTTIYAWDGGPLSKWAGTHFEVTSPEERQKVILDENILFSKKDYSNVNGWSVRHSLRAWPARSEIELQGQPVIFLTKVKDLPTTRREVSLELQLPGGRPQTILQAKSWPHLVRRAEYEHIFGQH